MPVIVAAMFLVGVSVGAESDLLSFLVARYFKLRIYNTTLSLLFVCSFAGSACGALAISGTLRLADSYSPFMYLVAIAITVGCLMFLALPRPQDADRIG
jgi:MFS family permease